VIRRYVMEDKGTLVDEIAFIDVQPDHATDMVQNELRKKAEEYAGRATMLYVRFEEMSHWRHNGYLLKTAREIGLRVLPLPPDPIPIDGRRFDPIEHFKEWRKRDGTTRAKLKLAAREGLRAALATVPEGNGRWKTIADQLNAAEIPTSGGKPWTAENVRKHAKQLDPTSAPQK
jgi:hypothetical protein